MDDQVAEMQRETRSSIEISRTSKGDYSYKAKIYFDESDKGNIVRAYGDLVNIDAWFLRRFVPAKGE